MILLQSITGRVEVNLTLFTEKQKNIQIEVYTIKEGNNQFACLWKGALAGK